MERKTAEQILSVAVPLSAKIEKTVKVVMDRCTEEVFQRYRRYAGRIMGHLFTEIIGPIWNEHPDLAPEWFRNKQSAPETAAARIPKEAVGEVLSHVQVTKRYLDSIPADEDPLPRDGGSG